MDKHTPTSCFLKMLKCNYFLPQITKPTASLIDNILTIFQEQHLLPGIILTHKRARFPLLEFLKPIFNHRRLTEKRNIVYRNIFGGNSHWDEILGIRLIQGRDFQHCTRYLQTFMISVFPLYHFAHHNTE